MELQTRRITAPDVALGFDCGKDSLDEYFRRYALAHDAKGVTRAYVWARDEGDDATKSAVLAYYTLSMASVESVQLSSALRRSLPRYPMPVALIGRFALTRTLQGGGRGLGAALLGDALSRVLEASEGGSCLGVVVDALDPQAESFYAKHDFVTVDASRWPRRMFIALRTVRDALECNGEHG